LTRDGRDRGGGERKGGLGKRGGEKGRLYARAVLLKCKRKKRKEKKRKVVGLIDPCRIGTEKKNSLRGRRGASTVVFPLAEEGRKERGGDPPRASRPREKKKNQKKKGGREGGSPFLSLTPAPGKKGVDAGQPPYLNLKEERRKKKKMHSRRKKKEKRGACFHISPVPKEKKKERKKDHSRSTKKKKV